MKILAAFKVLIILEIIESSHNFPNNGNLNLFLRSNNRVYTLNINGNRVHLRKPIISLGGTRKTKNERRTETKDILVSETSGRENITAIISRSSLRRLKRQTYPGTKWCGVGNEATRYEDLGTIEDVDRCCRDHDFCNVKIEAGKSDYGLKNDGFFTIVSCECERAFYDCLSAVPRYPHAAIIGFVYFDLFSPKCIGKKKVCTRYIFWRTVCISWKESEKVDLLSNKLDWFL
ncbi:phospholipase A2-like [Saccostrea cucullata]|uniref:phospholipase A2-like n=1 Tax=Saccostrea cuccullata TaxID=36930 RepID=UPI002ED6B2FC